MSSSYQEYLKNIEQTQGFRPRVVEDPSEMVDFAKDQYMGALKKGYEKQRDINEKGGGWATAAYQLAPETTEAYVNDEMGGYEAAIKGIGEFAGNASDAAMVAMAPQLLAPKALAAGVKSVGKKLISNPKKVAAAAGAAATLFPEEAEATNPVVIATRLINQANKYLRKKGKATTLSDKESEFPGTLHKASKSDPEDLQKFKDASVNTQRDFWGDESQHLAWQDFVYHPKTTKSDIEAVMDYIGMDP